MAVTPSPIYRIAVNELEQALPPRVVSRLLRDGMADLGTSPDRLSYDELVSILETKVRHQLFASLPDDRAQETLRRLSQQLAGAASGERADPAELIDNLKRELRPFNLYFEWPEVQELRSRIQQMEADASRGRPILEGAERAHELLAALQDRLELQLKEQAEDLARLESLAKRSSGGSGAKARRLEHLVGQIHEAQRQRHLATAELQRAWKLAEELGAVAAEEEVRPRPAADAPRRVERLSELAELRSLEREADRFAGQGLAGYTRLRELLDEALLEGPGDRLSGLLESAWRELESLKNPGAVTRSVEAPRGDPAVRMVQSRGRLAETRSPGDDLASRLGRSRGRLAGVEKLNNDGVERVRAGLRTVEEQSRNAEPDVRRQLEGRLDEIEALLDELEAEYRAARSVAGALVGGGAIEGVLGILDGDGVAPEGPDGCHGRPALLTRTLDELEDTRDLAFELAERLPEGGLLILSGPLGAGKTTLTSYLARALGSDAAVSSPTYTLVHEYPGVLGTLVHMDAYRLPGGRLEGHVDLDDYLARARLVVVEWGDKLAEAYPEAWLLRLERNDSGRMARLCGPVVPQPG